jgi:toxin YxiD
MRHILSRHHPRYYSTPATRIQTFLHPSLGPDDITRIVTRVLAENTELIARRGGRGQFEAAVDGITYVVAVGEGRVRQLYPR